MRRTLVLGALLLAACAPTMEAVDAGIDAPDASSAVPPTGQLDLLLVMDDSGYSWNGAPLSSEFAAALGALLSGDRDGDGVAELTPVRSLHVGVLMGDMGLGANAEAIAAPRCDVRGNDGVLRNDVSYTGCDGDFPARYPDRVLRFEQGAGTSVADLIRDVVCIGDRGGGGRVGCPYQAPLEAALKALSPPPADDGSSPVAWTAPGYRPPTFLEGTFGHGLEEATNGAFLRPDSVLAVLIVNAVEDCGTPNPHLHEPELFPYEGAPRNTCYQHPEELHPVERYVEGLLGLRLHPSRLVYAVIGGVPVDVSGLAPSTILADPAMQPMFDPVHRGVLDGCINTYAYALPAIRLTEVARDIQAAGGHATVHTMCSTHREAYDAFIRETLAAMAGTE